MKTRRQGRKKEVGVREKGVLSLEEAFRDGPHAQYLSQHGHVLREMRDRVQYPPPGMITYKDLTWLRAEEADAEADTISIDLEKLPETPKKKKAVKQVALIPWDRVPDFRDGEQRGRKDVETKFVRTKSDPRNVGQIKSFRWNVYIEYERYVLPDPVLYRLLAFPPLFVRGLLLFFKSAGGNASTGRQTSPTRSDVCRRTWFHLPGSTTRRGSASPLVADRRAPVPQTPRKVAPSNAAASACST